MTRITSEFQVPPSPSLFISNMTWWTSEDDIRAAFDDLSPRIKEVQFIEHKPNGKSKGMAVVEFVDTASAEAAKAYLEGRMIQGRICEVNYSRNAPIKPYERTNVNRNDGVRARHYNYNQSTSTSTFSSASASTNPSHHQNYPNYQDDDYDSRSNASSNSRYNSGDRRGRDYDRSKSPDRKYSSNNYHNHRRSSNHSNRS